MRGMFTMGLMAVSLLSSPLPAGENETSKDARLTVRTLNDGYHPWTPPKTKEAWEKEQQRLREQILVSQGLWPMPPKTPLNAVVHSPIDKGDYIIEKVFFESYPGHYVTGNLYRSKSVSGKVPGVLCPHGHWPNGRFYLADQKTVQSQIDQGAERWNNSAQSPLQARMVQLARMGCIVFHYDMVGYADSTQIPHREGFTDPTAGLWLQNFMGLQTWNSIRALDFLLSLENVDPDRIGVTGSSGGGTQTFMLCAIDDRPDVAFPAVMVSTGMQGGCICENAPYLRIGVNNIALAAAFAPKPMAMSGADDWTIAIETKGLPELRQVYSLNGQQDLVAATCWPDFKHNYNQPAREFMYNWFNIHLQLGRPSPVKEEPFDPVPVQELSVFGPDYPLPKNAVDAEGLKEYLTKISQEQFQNLLPKKAEEVERYREVIGTAARVMLDERMSGVKDQLEFTDEKPEEKGSFLLSRGVLGRKNAKERVPYIVLLPQDFEGHVVLWIDGKGLSHLLDEQGQPTAAVQKLLDQKIAVASIDPFLIGANELPEVNKQYSGYTFCYNRPLLSNRVRDILTAIQAAHGGFSKSLTLVGTGEAGPWVALAAALAGDQVDRTITDLGGFSFGTITSTQDPMYLPGALKYGDIGGLLALAAPGKLTLYGTKGIPENALAPLSTVYKTSAASENVKLHAERLNPEDVPGLILSN